MPIARAPMAQRRARMRASVALDDRCSSKNSDEGPRGAQGPGNEATLEPRKTKVMARDRGRSCFRVPN